MLARFFKPKWQHRKAEVRLRAVSKLSANDPSASEILNQIALQDHDAEVRRAALTRVLDASLLIRASEEDSNEHNRITALQQITHLISGEQGQLNDDARTSLLPHIKSTELLLHLVLNCNESDVGLAALELIADEAALLDLIRQSENKEIRRQAAQRIEQSDLLEQLERESRGKDKRLYRIARDKLQLQREQIQLANARLERRQTLLTSLQQLEKGEEFPQFGAKLDALNLEWQRCDEDASNDEQQLWQQLTDSCQTRRQQIEQRRQAEAEAAALNAAQQQQIHQLQQTLNDYVTPDTLAEVTERWQTLKAEADSGTQRAVEQALSQQQKQHAAEQALEQHQEQLTQLNALLDDELSTLASPELKKWQKHANNLSKAIDWPQTLPLPNGLKKLAQLQEAIKSALSQQKQQQSALQAELDAELDSLNQYIAAGEARQADKQHSHVLKLQNRFNSAQQQRYKTLYAKLQELRDWQGYALTPKREALCEQMESLIDSSLAADELAAEIRQLQQQWRELDSSGSVHSRTLWQRFKKASDQAYQPCNEYYSEQRQLRQHNLERREQMCHQLDGYLAQVDWDDVDWRALEEITRTAKQEWRSYSPVDRSPGKVLQTRFNKQINTLESRLKGHRKAVQQTKEVLLQQAAALLDAEDLQLATEQAKELQQQWKDAGTTFRTQERKLWSEFRAHCNALFEKRNETQQQNRAQQRKEQSELKQLCTALEELRQTQDSISEREHALQTLDQQYQQLCDRESSLNSAQQKQYQQLSALLHAQLGQRKQLFGEPWQCLQHKAALCQKLEDALIAGEQDNVRDELTKQWQSSDSPSVAEWHTAINRRFEQLLMLCENTSELATYIAGQEEPLRQLCIRLEITSGNPSPEEDQALRLEYQMQRLQQALQRQQDGYDLTDIQQLMSERLCVPFHHYHEQLNQRFDQLLAGYNLN